MLVLAALGACRPSVVATSSSSCPSEPLEDARFGRHYVPCQLTTLPLLQVDTTGAYFPGMMRGAGMSGRVRVTFVVDTAGHYVPGSLRVISSNHDMFSVAAKRLIQRAHFSPGRIGRKVVPTELTHEFIFVIPPYASLRELGLVPELVSAPETGTPYAVPALEIRLDAEDTTLGSAPDPALRDSLAHVAIRLVARELGWQDDSVLHTSGSAELLLCVQGDTSLFESATDRALAKAMARPHVRIMTQRGCPSTRASMVALPAELQPRYPPDSVPFVEPHRLQVTRVALRRGGGPQVDLFDEYMIGGLEYRCVRVPGTSSIYVLRCLLISTIAH